MHAGCARRTTRVGGIKGKGVRDRGEDAGHKRTQGTSVKSDLTRNGHVVVGKNEFVDFSYFREQGRALAHAALLSQEEGRLGHVVAKKIKDDAVQETAEPED